MAALQEARNLTHHSSLFGWPVRRCEKNFRALELYSRQTAGPLDPIIGFRQGKTLPLLAESRTPPRVPGRGSCCAVRARFQFGRTVMGHEARKYLGYARECVRQAEQAPTQERRGRLIELARVWMAAASNEEAAKRKGPSPSGLPRVAL